MPRGGKKYDATGQRYGKLLVVEHSHSKHYPTSKNTIQHWKCLCDCGNTTIVSISSLRWGSSRSCGCTRAENIERLRLKRLARNPRKGMSKTHRYKLWQSAKERAAKLGRDFDIEIDDVVIPTHCPILGIPLERGKGVMHAGSPQLDRIDNSKGYVKGNVAVISQRANSIKQNASIEMLEAILKYMKGEL